MSAPLSLSRRDVVKLLAASPLLATVPPVRGEAFTPTPAIPDVSLQSIGLPPDTRILVAENRSYWELYPRDEPLSLEQIERLPTGVGLRFKLVASGLAATGLVTLGEGDAKVSTEGLDLVVDFPQTVSLTPQHHQLTLHATTAEGTRSQEYFLNLQYNSKAQDAAAGRTAFSRITVRDTNLRLSYSHAHDWIIDSPSEADRDYATRTWGHLYAAGDPPGRRARAVVRHLITEFESRRGTPSDIMNGLHPFRQYERLLADQDFCWCANICEISCHALNSLDLPCRLIRMRHTYHNADPNKPGQDFELLLAGGHTVMEIYDDAAGQWIFIDPTLRRLGVRDAAGHSLNFFELHLQVNQPHHAAGLVLDAFDPATQTTTTESFLESAVRPNLSHYAKREQRFYYFRRGDA